MGQDDWQGDWPGRGSSMAGSVPSMHSQSRDPVHGEKLKWQLSSEVVL